MEVILPQPQITKHEISTQTDLSGVVVQLPHDPSEVAVQLLKKLPTKDQLRFVSDFLSKIAHTHYDIHIQSDFLQLSLNAIRHLKKCSRSNVVYGVAKAIGSMRPDGSDSRLPAKKMPMGLLEHIVNFFNADTYNKVRNSVIFTFVENYHHLNMCIDRKVSRGLPSVARYYVFSVWW